MKRLAVLAAIVGCIGCTAPDRSTEALRSYGFHDITITGWSPFTCSGEDSFATGFSAKNSNNQSVTGAVCCGLLKGCTVRM